LDTQIGQGLFPSSVSLGGPRARGWYANETAAVIVAWGSAEFTASKIKALVAGLIQQRHEDAARLEEEFFATVKENSNEHSEGPHK